MAYSKNTEKGSVVITDPFFYALSIDREILSDISQDQIRNRLFLSNQTTR